MARGAYFKEDGISVKSCWLAGVPDAGAVKLGEETTLLTKWKHSVLGQAAKPATKEELTKNSPMFSCARWSKELYDLVLALDKKWCSKELKGQAKAARRREPTLEKLSPSARRTSPHFVVWRMSRLKLC